jgi:hypothetical protein
MIVSVARLSCSVMLAKTTFIGFALDVGRKCQFWVGRSQTASKSVREEKF